MSYFLAFAGFAALIILHEFGHFVAAKAVGMRVERFALFFPPLIAKVRRGETEYGIGAIPFGGYVKISGMNPHEELPPDVEPRAYYRQAPWKRILVIAAGPTVNLVLAFVILSAIYLAQGTASDTTRVDRHGLQPPASRYLRPGDRILGVDGHGGSAVAIHDAIVAHGCAVQPPTAGCVATTPARVVVVREGKRLTFSIPPRYDAKRAAMRLGFTFAIVHRGAGVGRAASLSVSEMWRITSATFSRLARLFNAHTRHQLTGTVGLYRATQQAFSFDITQALFVLALISLALGVFNLFPFLPLDGGHIFWALAEKVRGRPVPFWVIERVGVVGFVLILFIAAIGLSNDIHRLHDPNFGIR